MKVLVIIEGKFEDSELVDPKYILEKKGVEVDVATPDGEKRRGKHGNEVKADLTIEEAITEDYDALLIPGGGSPEELRDYSEAIELLKEFYSKGKVIAAICHGPQLLVSAGLAEGKRLTCYSGIRKDIEEAGADYENSSVVIDGNIITSRSPEDISNFTEAIFDKIQEQK